MGIQIFVGDRADMIAAVAFVFIALSCASNVPTIGAQKAVEVSVAYALPQGFFIFNVLDNGVLGANSTRSLTGGIPYARALVNTEFYLFNLTYGRDAAGGKAPPNFNSSQYFEINLLSTASNTFLEWNVYSYRDQVDLYHMISIVPETNTLFAFDLVDEVKKIYVIRSKLNPTLCVTTTGGGVDFVLLPYTVNNQSQQFQLIDAFSPNPPPPGQVGILDVSAAFSLAKGFFVSNVLDNALLGANKTWQLVGGTPYAKALVNPDHYLFNLTYNRTSSAGGSAPPSFDASQYFEINLISKNPVPNTYLQWNVWEFKDQVDLFQYGPNAPGTNALFGFELVDDVNKVYVIRPKFTTTSCVSTKGGGADFVLKPCQLGNTAQRFQLMNPFGNTDSSSSDTDFFSTAGGVIVILVIIGVGLGAAYGGWRFWKKRNESTKLQKSGTSQPALLTALNTNGAEQDGAGEAHGSYRKIGDNMELGHVQENNGHSAGSGSRASTRRTSPNNDY